MATKYGPAAQKSVEKAYKKFKKGKNRNRKGNPLRDKIAQEARALQHNRIPQGRNRNRIRGGRGNEHSRKPLPAGC